MRMNNFLLNRKSVRDYRNRKISRREMRKIEELADNIASQGSKRYFDFIIFNDGKKIYENLDGHGGYKGRMIESPHYIGIRLREVSNEAIVRASYYTEELISELIELDLGTCWTTIKDVDIKIREEALGEENKNIGYLVAFGHPSPKNPFDTVEEGKTDRKPVEELVFKNELGEKIEIRELEDRGLENLFYYVKFAPSTQNSQPWRFVIKNDKVVLYLSEIDGKINYMDAGIIMYYFSSLVTYIGLSNKWNLNEKLNDKETMDGYKEIAYYKL